MRAMERMRGEVVGGLQALPQVKDGPLPPLPQPRMGSPALWCTAVLTPHRVHPRVSATLLGRALPFAPAL